MCGSQGKIRVTILLYDSTEKGLKTPWKLHFANMMSHEHGVTQGYLMLNWLIYAGFYLKVTKYQHYMMFKHAQQTFAEIGE